MGRKLLGFLVGAVLLALAQYAWLTPLMDKGLRSWTVYAFLLCANLLYLYNVLFHLGARPRWQVGLVVGWYVVLFLFFVLVAPGRPEQRWLLGGTHRLLLYGLFLMVSCALLHLPWAFGLLVVALVAYFVFPFFAEPTLVLLAVFYLVSLALLREARRHHNYLLPACFVLGFALLLAVLFPLVNMGISRSPQDVDTLARSVSPEAAATRRALWMSVQTATVATLVVLVLGVPLAYVLVRSDFRGRGVLDALVDLPIVVPPPVAGWALVVLVGERQALGVYLREQWGIELASAWGGIVLAQVFVSSPFLIRSAMAAFRAVDPRLENVSRTLGAGPLRTFVRVTLPLSARGIFIGCILTWGRAIGEFGSVAFIAMNPETVPVRIYNEWVASGAQGSGLTLAVLMVGLCVMVFAALHLLASRTLWRNVETLWSRLRGAH